MWNSRKFRILVGDAIFAAVILAITELVSPGYSEFILKLIAILQAPIMALIAGIAIEDAGYKASGKFPHG